MGGILNGLTKASVISPQGQQTFYDTPTQALDSFKYQLANQQVPTQTTTMDNAQLAVPPVAPVGDLSGSAGSPATGTPQVQHSAPMQAPPIFVKQPSFASTIKNPMTGMPNNVLSNPAQTKLGKLASFLGLTAQGAMAGQAAAEQQVAASGGHRSGGFGTGFQAGMTEPYRQAELQRQNQMGALQTQQAQMQMQQAQTPVSINGQQVPFWYAKRQADLNKERYIPNRTGGFMDTLSGQVVGAPEKPTDKMINAYVGADGKQHVIYQRPDNTQYESVYGDVNQKDPKEPTTIDSAWLTGFRQEHGREPNSSEIAAYKKSNAQATHFSVHVNQGNPEDVESLAQGLANYTLSPQSMGRINGADKEKIIARARQINPKFDMTTYPAKQAVITAYASGKQADQLQAFDAFLGHANDLSESVNELRNLPIPIINKPWNWIQKHAAGDATIAAYYAKMQPVRDEFMTFLQNNHALTETDKKDVDAIMDPNASPAQMQAVLRSMVHTASIRLGSLNQRYKNQIGQDYPNLVSPEGQQIIQKFGSKIPNTRPPLSNFER